MHFLLFFTTILRPTISLVFLQILTLPLLPTQLHPSPLSLRPSPGPPYFHYLATLLSAPSHLSPTPSAHVPPALLSPSPCYILPNPIRYFGDLTSPFHSSTSATVSSTHPSNLLSFLFRARIGAYVPFHFSVFCSTLTSISIIFLSGMLIRVQVSANSSFDIVTFTATDCETVHSSAPVPSRLAPYMFRPSLLHRYNGLRLRCPGHAFSTLTVCHVVFSRARYISISCTHRMLGFLCVMFGFSCGEQTPLCSGTLCTLANACSFSLPCMWHFSLHSSTEHPSLIDDFSDCAFFLPCPKGIYLGETMYRGNRDCVRTAYTQ